MELIRWARKLDTWAVAGFGMGHRVLCSYCHSELEYLPISKKALCPTCWSRKDAISITRERYGVDLMAAVQILYAAFGTVGNHDKADGDTLGGGGNLPDVCPVDRAWTRKGIDLRIYFKNFRRNQP